MRTLLRLTLLAGVVACDAGQDDTDAADTDHDTDAVVGGLPSICDPLDPSVCALPFPSSHFLVPDAGTGTGLRVALQTESLPVNRDDVAIDPFFWNERDGFSINTPMLTYFDDVSLEGTVPVDDIGRYAADDVKTVIIDTVTGERLPHWVELDATAPSPDQSLLMMRPAVPMEWNRRYVVGIRGLTTTAGGPVEVSPAFQALRDGGDSPERAVQVRRQHFEDEVFPVLEEAGFARGELQLAWDFHTASRDNVLGRMEWMRDDAFAWVEEEGWTYDLEVEDADCSVEGTVLARKVAGTFQAPLYTVADASENPYDKELQAVLTRDEHGMPYRNGTTSVGFLLRVPCSVAHGPDGTGAVPGAAPLIQYGHGLLGSKSEVDYGSARWLREMADREGFLIVSADWTGFMEDDIPAILQMMAAIDQEKVNPSHFAIIAERSMQGMVEQMLLTRLVRDALIDDPVLAFPSADDTPVAVLDPGKTWYYGISQGAIMGSALMAMSPDLNRGILSVGGGPYSLLLPRSKDFDPYFLLLRNKYKDHRKTMLFVAGLTQQVWDPVEPGGWMWDMTRDAEIPNQVLMQVAVYDNQVTTLGAHYQARAYGAFLPKTAVRVPWGLEEVDVGAGRVGSALVEFAYDDLPDEPLVSLPPGSDEVTPAEYLDGRELDPHECPRRQREGQDQIWRFLTTGEVIQTCGPEGCVAQVEGICD